MGFICLEVIREQTTKHLTVKVLFSQTKTAKMTEQSISVLMSSQFIICSSRMEEDSVILWF